MFVSLYLKIIHIYSMCIKQPKEFYTIVVISHISSLSSLSVFEHVCIRVYMCVCVCVCVCLQCRSVHSCLNKSGHLRLKAD